ncbi:hypothetical protein Vretimale_3164 [Volvox reticuliferus]|nr:hypothetical protein Vretifemale_6583 [Volvox reticuliferus]GIL97514.1 hypothetical protein Vretimale_3164 [Volvox reticuliferus]
MQLLARGVLPCAAAIDTRSYMLLPRAVPLPTLTREVLLLGSYDTTAGAGPAGRAETQASARADGRSLCSDSSSSSNGGLTGLNTCTSEVLVEMLRHLKRSYWPFPWDTAVDAVYPAAVGSHGGFRSAAKAAMGDDVSAALAAIGKVAAWRLERGIWTSPGAGDLRRALAACERLVLLAGEQYPEERRDLAVLLLHCGNVGAARLELRTYLKSVSGPGGASLAAFSSLPVAREAESRTTALWGPDDRPDPFDLVLCRRLLQALDGAGAEAGNDLSAPGLEEPEEALGVESTLKAMPPWEQPPSSGGNSTRRYLPLTW